VGRGTHSNGHGATAPLMCSRPTAAVDACCGCCGCGGCCGCCCGCGCCGCGYGCCLLRRLWRRRRQLLLLRSCARRTGLLLLLLRSCARRTAECIPGMCGWLSLLQRHTALQPPRTVGLDRCRPILCGEPSKILGAVVLLRALMLMLHSRMHITGCCLCGAWLPLCVCARARACVAVAAGAEVPPPTRAWPCLCRCRLPEM
jgi:hypothetical protein